MSVHTRLWYLQRFRMLDALTDAQKRAVDKMTRMLDVPRGRRIYLAGDPSDQIFSGLARETVNIVLQDFRQRGLVEADRRSIRIKDPDRLRRVV